MSPLQNAGFCITTADGHPTEIDASALQILYEVVQAYAARGVLVYWADLHTAALQRLRTAGIIDVTGRELMSGLLFESSGPDCGIYQTADCVHPTVHKALEALNESNVLSTA